MLLGLAWLSAPAATRWSIDHGMRDLRRNEGLVGTFGAVRHAGAGLSLEDLAITTTSGEPMLSVHRIRVRPAAAWPPARVEIDGLRLTQRGIDSWEQGFGSANASWHSKVSETIARDYLTTRALTFRAELHDVMVERGAGTTGTRSGVVTLAIPSRERVHLTFAGNLSLAGACGNADVFSAMEADVSADQDSLQLHFQGDTTTFAKRCPECPVGHFDAIGRIPSPGWSAPSVRAVYASIHGIGCATLPRFAL